MSGILDAQAGRRDDGVPAVAVSGILPRQGQRLERVEETATNMVHDLMISSSCNRLTPIPMPDERYTGLLPGCATVFRDAEQLGMASDQVRCGQCRDFVFDGHAARSLSPTVVTDGAAAPVKSGSAGPTQRHAARCASAGGGGEAPARTPWSRWRRTHRDRERGSLCATGEPEVALGPRLVLYAGDSLPGAVGRGAGRCLRLPGCHRSVLARGPSGVHQLPPPPAVRTSTSARDAAISHLRSSSST